MLLQFNYDVRLAEVVEQWTSNPEVEVRVPRLTI